MPGARLVAAFAVGALRGATLASGAAAPTGLGPEQIHLALTSEPSAVSVTWVSLESPGDDAKVWYAQGSDGGQWVDAAVHQYTAGAETRWVGTAIMNGLTPDAPARYKVRHNGQESVEIFFRAPPIERRPVRIIAFGDMGTGDYKDHFGPGGALYNDKYVASLVGTPEEPDLVLHVGDVAYDRGNETVWDVFFRNIEPYARHIPYLTCVGNEDHWYNYAGYVNRFFLPSQTLGSQEAPRFYSIDYSYMHLISISTEADLEPYAPGSRQYTWLEDDLKWANSNREKVPWIVVLGHRPLYCSSNDYYDCNMWGPKARGVFEPLFQQYGVDLYLAGHVHSYERTFPVVNGTKLSDGYDSPGATTHLMVGMGGAGCTGKWSHQPDWSAVRIGHYGVGSIWMDRHNLTFTLVETQGQVQSADRIVITKGDRDIVIL